MGKQKARSPKLFLVVRLGWRNWHPGGYERFRDPRGHPYETGRPVAAYASRQDAEARCTALEAEARASLNPFAFFEAGDYWLADYSSLFLDEFEKRLRKALPGVKLPGKDKYGTRPWLAWWDKIIDGVTDEQRAAVWALFDRAHFYAVVSTKWES